MGLIQETDYGTPAARSARQVTLTIDGKPVTAPEGTVLNCVHPAAVNGLSGEVAACITKVVADACVIIPTVSSDRVTPHTEGFCAVVWHLLVSHPALQRGGGRFAHFADHANRVLIHRIFSAVDFLAVSILDVGGWRHQECFVVFGLGLLLPEIDHAAGFGFANVSTVNARQARRSGRRLHPGPGPAGLAEALTGWAG